MNNRTIREGVRASLNRQFQRKDGDDLPGPSEIKSLEDLKTAFLTQHRALKSWIEKANGEVKAAGSASAETKQALVALTESLNSIGVRIDKVEAKGNRQGEGVEFETIGARLLKAQPFQDLKTMSRGDKRRVHLPDLDIKAIINAAGQNQPLVPQQQLPGVQIQPNRILRIRQLLPTGRTTSNLIQYAKENVFTNNAGPQAGGSPTVAGENVTKNESDITFTLANAPVVTLAHFIVASTQILDDAPMLQAYIENRLLYGLALEEEDEILNGDGTVGQLSGLMLNATGYNRSAAGTKIDQLRRSMTQLALSEYSAEVIVLNPADWEDIELTKDTTGQYVLANPQSLLGPHLWGLPVLPTNSMTSGQFLTANLTQAAMLWDRQDANVQISLEDSDNFRKNMATIRAEERVALTVFRGQALIKGTFGSGT